MNDEFRDKLNKEWQSRLQENVKKISESAIFCGMLNGKFDDPLQVMQFGLAIFMDKPIYLLVNKGTPIPENLRKLAKGIEVVDYDNTEEMAEAVKRITEGEDGGK